MSKDMTNDLVEVYRNSKKLMPLVHLPVQCKNSVGVAEHGDHVETIQKEMEQIAHYEDIKDVVRKHFGEYTGRTTLTE